MSTEQAMGLSCSLAVARSVRSAAPGSARYACFRGRCTSRRSMASGYGGRLAAGSTGHYGHQLILIRGRACVTEDNLSRRRFLGLAAGGAAAAFVLSACGSDDEAA